MKGDIPIQLGSMMSLEIMKLGLKNIFEDSLKHVKLNKNEVVLDIGANDGTLLSYYKKLFLEYYFALI